MNPNDDYIEIFKMADTKKKGYITRDQLIRQMKRFGYKNIDKDIEILFAKTTKNNKLKLKDFLDAMALFPNDIHRAAYLRRVFKLYDVDGNNLLDKQELKQATSIWGEQLTKDELEVLMMIMDKDMNSLVDLEEFIYALNNLGNLMER